MKRLDFTKVQGEVNDIAAIHQWLDRSIKYLMNGSYTLALTKIVKKRTLPQNRLMWMWFKCLEDCSGQSAQDWHDYYCKKYASREMVTPDGQVVKLAGHTSQMNTAQMTDFLNNVQADAATEWGVTLPLPEEQGYDEFRLQYERMVQ